MCHRTIEASIYFHLCHIDSDISPESRKGHPTDQKWPQNSSYGATKPFTFKSVDHGQSALLGGSQLYSPANRIHCSVDLLSPPLSTKIITPLTLTRPGRRYCTVSGTHGRFAPIRLRAVVPDFLLLLCSVYHSPIHFSHPTKHPFPFGHPVGVCLPSTRGGMSDCRSSMA